MMLLIDFLMQIFYNSGDGESGHYQSADLDVRQNHWKNVKSIISHIVKYALLHIAVLYLWICAYAIDVQID